MRKVRARTIGLSGIALAACSVTPSYGVNFHYSTLDYPGKIMTSLTGISGKTIVGNSSDLLTFETGFGFSASGGTFQNIADATITNGHPLASYARVTSISGNTIAGTYKANYSGLYAEVGFTETNGVFTHDIGKPLIGTTYLDQVTCYIDHGVIFGTYRKDNGADTGSYTFTNGVYTKYPNVARFIAADGNTLYGSLSGWGVNVDHLFSLTNGKYTYFDVEVPGVSSGIYVPETRVRGISGNTFVGTMSDAHGVHGFVDIDGTYTIFNVPGSSSTRFDGIDGNTVVGSYTTSDQHEHGLIVTLDGIDGIGGSSVPEPSTAALIALTVPLLARRRKNM